MCQGWVLRYHVGSMALGSFIVAVVTVIQIVTRGIFEYMQKNSGSSQTIKIVAACVDCCLACFKKTIEFINSYAYIVRLEGAHRLSAESTVHSAESTMQSPQCRVHNAESTVQSPQCRVHNAESTVQSPQCRVHSQECRAHSHGAAPTVILQRPQSYCSAHSPRPLSPSHVLCRTPRCTARGTLSRCATFRHR